MTKKGKASKKSISPVAERVEAGSVGGSANEVGSLFRSGVAAWFVAHGLRGLPVPDMRLDSESGVPVAISFETDDAVDDIRIDCSGGPVVLVQAKRSISLSSRSESEFEKVVKQWKKALKTAIDPNKIRLVLASEKLTGPLESLRSGLERRRKKYTGEQTKGEQDALAALDAHLIGVSDTDKTLLAEVIVVTSFDAISEGGAHLTAASILMDGWVVQKGEGAAAWKTLSAEGRLLGARRLGNSIKEWVKVLRESKLHLVTDAQASLSARWIASEDALLQYRRGVVNRGKEIELIAVGDAKPLKVANPGESLRGTAPDTRKSSLAWLIRKATRSILVGLPGSGKSTALRQLAAYAAAQADGPVPLLVKLPHFAKTAPAGNERSKLIALALEWLPLQSRSLVESRIEQLIDDGQVQWLLDGLDECSELRSQVIERLRPVLDDMPSGVEIVISTRDVAYASAQTLGFSTIRLEMPDDFGALTRQCAENIAAKNSIAQSKTWVDAHLQRVAQIREQDPLLRETPLLGILLTIIVCEKKPIHACASCDYFEQHRVAYC